MCVCVCAWLRLFKHCTDIRLVAEKMRLEAFQDSRTRARGGNFNLESDPFYAIYDQGHSAVIDEVSFAPACWMVLDNGWPPADATAPAPRLCCQPMIWFSLSSCKVRNRSSLH